MSDYYIGLMSGTSLDAVDAVLMDFTPIALEHKLAGHVALAYPSDLRQRVLDLHAIGQNELHQAKLLANELTELYARSVERLLQETAVAASAVRAIGCHGQTVRHAPEHGYTIQLGNLALLAEKTGIDVIGDFRSRDIAAAGQGAPLVPAFHQAVFADDDADTVVLNIGGIANISVLSRTTGVSGFDTGPGNMLLDAWTQQNWHKNYDENGRFASSGTLLPDLLARLAADPYFALPAPKSTGRDYFNLTWLNRFLSGTENPYDVQATLLTLTAKTIAQAVRQAAPLAKKLLLCGGGTNNQALCTALQNALPQMTLLPVDALGVNSQCVEAAAFAWLARQFTLRCPANVPAVTGATGLRVLGALYPA